MALALKDALKGARTGSSLRRGTDASGSSAAGAEVPLLEVTDLRTEFRTKQGWLTAVNDVSFTLRPGRVLAILGESGSGKSAMLRTLLGIQPRSARIGGRAVLQGRDLISMSMRERERVRGSEISMVFQDPMTALDPVFTVEQQLVETIRRHHHVSKREAVQRALDALELVQIPSPERRLKAYPFELSGGMRQRVVIAMALVSHPSLLLADEPTTALDVTVQARVLELLRDLRTELGMGIIFVTHDLAVAAQVADDVAVMYAGRIVERGTVAEIVRAPRHPYTRGLLQANVRPGQRERPEAIPGAPPNLAKLPPGCAFAPRCAFAEDACWEGVPDLVSLTPTHDARCLRVDAVQAAVKGAA